ncbi:MAG TPA: hypothetical protein VKC53_02435 [Patescibacteria group bacterium]|nr:hypothetical protein [Patescibacteria group bacterium]
MSKFTFILGLAGSGKSFLAKEMKQKDKSLLVVDDDFHPIQNKDKFDKDIEKIKQAVLNNSDIVIIEGAFCFKDFRDPMRGYLKLLFPTVDFEWMCFENNIAKANKNLDNEDRKDRNPEGHKNMNINTSAKYSYPDECKIIPIFEKEL